MSNAANLMTLGSVPRTMKFGSLANLAIFYIIAVVEQLRS